MNNNTINTSNKNNENIEKKKKKSNPININLNHGQFLFKNNINKIASSYISMGRKIQTRKSRKISRIQVSTNSIINNYTKQATTSSYILNNSKNVINKSDFGYINVNKNNYNNYNKIQNEVVNKIEKNKFKFTKRIIHSKDRKQLSTSSNSNISNDLFINGYKTSINNLNNIKIKNKVINLSIAKDNISKNQENYSSRAKYLDSRNKTKKISMKSKLQQFRSKKNISTSYLDSYTTKRQLRDKLKKNINNSYKKDLFNKIEKIYGKNYSIIHMNQNLYKIRHLRNNTTNFGQKEIMNIFHKKTLLNKFINDNTNKITGNTINNINNININNNIYINNDKNININKLQKSLNKNIETNIKIPNLFHKINYQFKSKEKIKKTAKINNNDIRIYIKEKKLKLSDNKQNSSLQNKFLSDNISNFRIIPGIKKITIKGNDNKISNISKIDIYNHIPIPTKKLKNDEIPSQRAIKFNYIKISQNTKKKKCSKATISRKSSSKKGDSKGNKNQFSSSQIKSKSLIKKNDDSSILKTNDIKRNINFDDDKTRVEEVKNIARDIEINNFNNLRHVNNTTNLNNNISENKISYAKKDELTKYAGKTDSNYSIDNNLDIIEINKKDSKNIYQKGNINTNYYEEKKYQRKIEEIPKTEKMDKAKENLKENKIFNDLFVDENLEDLPEDYDEDFNDLYSIVNKINFGRVLVGVEGFFTHEGKTYKKYKDKFDKFYDKLCLRKKNINSNSNVKKKNVLEVASMASNAKTNYSSSKKGIVNNI